MAECTDLERKLLDLLASSGDKANLFELQDELAVERIGPELRELYIGGATLVYRGSAQRDRAMDAMEKLGVTFRWKASSELYEELEAEAKKRAGIE